MLFAAIRNLTEGESAGVTLGLQAVVGLVVAGVIVLVVRRRR